MLCRPTVAVKDPGAGRVPLRRKALPRPHANGRTVDVLSSVMVMAIRALTGYLLGARQLVTARHLVDWGLRNAAGSADLWALRGQIFLRTAGAVTHARQSDLVALLEEAEAAYTRAEELRPDQLEVVHERGLTLLRLGWALTGRGTGAPRPDLLTAAVAEFTRVLEAHPRRAEVYHERAMAHATLRSGLPDRDGLGWLEKAAADLDASLRLRPHSPEALFHRAEVCSEIGRLHRRAGRRAAEAEYRRRSLEDCSRALELRRHWEAPMLLRAMESAALTRLGQQPALRTDEAISDLGRILEREPRNAQAILVRADVRVATASHFARQGDARGTMVWRQALTDLEAAMDAVGLRGREDVVAVRAAARAEWAEGLRHAGDLDGARDAFQRSLDDYERAVDDDPADIERLAGRARTFAGLAELTVREDLAAERRIRAVEDLDQALALRPGDPQLIAARAEFRTRRGTAPEQIRAALAEVDEALALAPEHESLRGARRRLLVVLAGDSGGGLEAEERLEWLAAALTECESALRRNPEDAQAHYDQARVLFLAGRPAEAYAALEQALGKEPGLRHIARRDPVWEPVAQAEGFRRLVGV